MRFSHIAATFVIIGLIAIVSLCLFLKIRHADKLAPMLSEEEVKKHAAPFISDFLGLSFPGQYAPYHGIGETRTMPYLLTDEERDRAIKKLQDTFQTTHKVSVAVPGLRGNQLNISDKESLLFYDQYLITELSKQTELIGNTQIDTFSTMTAGTPVIIFTLHPSEVRFVFLSFGTMYVTLKTHNKQWERYSQRWRGDMEHLRLPLLNAQFHSGESVRSVVFRLTRVDWLADVCTSEKEEIREPD
jgi:hypothetical protein